MALDTREVFRVKIRPPTEKKTAYFIGIARGASYNISFCAMHITYSTYQTWVVAFENCVSVISSFDSSPSPNQNTSLKSSLLYFWWCPFVRLSLRTKHTDQRVKPLLKLVLVCGSLYDSSLVYFYFWTIVYACICTLIEHIKLDFFMRVSGPCKINLPKYEYYIRPPRVKKENQN